METFTENDVYSVSTLTVAIKNILEKNFNSITVKGEISNLKRQSSGHIYFSLKDENAQIFCAFFKGFTQNLKFMPKDGDKVIITGDVAVYPPRGNYQMIVKEMNLLGVGELLLKLHELKKKLKEKGYFE